MTNEQFIQNWLKNPEDKGYGNLHSSTTTLWSYCLAICRVFENPKRYIILERGPSQTTNRHIALVRRNFDPEAIVLNVPDVSPFNIDDELKRLDEYQKELQERYCNTQNSLESRRLYKQLMAIWEQSNEVRWFKAFEEIN